MSTKKQAPAVMTDIELMEQYDALSAGLAGSEVLRIPGCSHQQIEKLRGLQHGSEIIRGHLELQAEQASMAMLDSEKMWAAIDGAIGDAAVTTGRVLRTSIVLEDRSLKHGAAGVAGQAVDTTQESTNGGAWAWMASHRAHFVTAVVSAGVVAGIALWARPTVLPANQRLAVAPVEVPQASALLPNSDNQPVLLRAVTPTDVESLDVPDGSGTVMTISDDDGETAVIWISPKDTEGM